QYRFPAGHSLGEVEQWSFHARIQGKDLQCGSDSHPLKVRTEGDAHYLDGMQKKARLDRDVTLNIVDTRAELPLAALGRVSFSSALHEGARYLMLRYRPELAVQTRRENRDWVFLFESSGDRDPLLARVQIDIIRSLLTNAEHYDTFAVLAAGTRVTSFSPTRLPVTPANIQAALDFLESSHLIGALDLGQGLTEAGKLLKDAQNPYLVHVGSGIAALGERREPELVKKVPQGAHYVGVGIGRRWSRSFMKRAAETTGGYFTQINPDEAVSWRAFDLGATLNTPRLMDVQVLPGNGASKFLCYA